MTHSSPILVASLALVALAGITPSQTPSHLPLAVRTEPGFVQWGVADAHPNMPICLVVGTRRQPTVLPDGQVLSVFPDVGTFCTSANAAGDYQSPVIALPPAVVGSAFEMQVVSADLPRLGLPDGLRLSRPHTLEPLGQSAQIADVFLLFGQSNAEGQASASALPATLTPPGGFQDVQIWNQTAPTPGWQDLQAGVNNTTSGNSAWCGPEMSLAFRLRQLQPGRTVYLVKFAVGQTSLGPTPGPWNEWGVNAGELYAEFHRRIDSALAQLRSRGLRPRIRAAFFMQGENDALTEPLARGYEQGLQELIQDLRETLDETADGSLLPVNGLPFVIGQISSRLSLLGPFFVEVVRTAQALVAGSGLGTGLVDTSGFSLRGDGIHFDTGGVVDLGLGLADQYERIVAAWAR